MCVHSATRQGRLVIIARNSISFGPPKTLLSNSEILHHTWFSNSLLTPTEILRRSAYSPTYCCAKMAKEQHARLVADEKLIWNVQKLKDAKPQTGMEVGIMNKRRRIRRINNKKKKKELGLKIPQVNSKLICLLFLNFEYLPKDGLFLVVFSY